MSKKKKLQKLKEKEELRRAKINSLRESIECEERELGRFEAMVLMTKARIKKRHEELDELYREDSVVCPSCY